MPTRFPNFPAKVPAPSTDGSANARTPATGCRVVPFRSRNPVDVADQFAADLADRGTRVINCDDCVLFGTGACEDCVVTFLLSLHDTHEAKRAERLDTDDARRIEIGADECDTLELLQASGLAPMSQFTVRPISIGARRR